jgi:hypothetical protein
MTNGRSSGQSGRATSDQKERIMSQPTFVIVTPSSYTSQHFVKYPTANGLLAYTMTGVALLAFKGTGQDFNRKTLELTVPIPDLPAGQGLQLVHWAPFVTLASISNDGPAANAAWAVDTFSLPNAGQVLTSQTIECQLAVRDIDGYLLRVAYTLHLVGKTAPLSRPR